MKVAFVLYDNFTMLDIVGPFNVLTFMPGCEPVWVAEEIGPVEDHTRSGALIANTRFADCLDPDIVVVPGGLGTERHFDGPVVEWLRAVRPGAKWMTSVCTGSHLLGSACES
jgi:putative intracellular protease/amidase